MVKQLRNADPHAPTLNSQTTWPAVLMVTDVSGLLKCRLLHITDRTNRLTFLVDTGAQVSVAPPTRTDHLRKQEGFALSAVNGTAIVTYGTRSLTLNLGLHRNFRWIFFNCRCAKTPPWSPFPAPLWPSS